LWYHTNYKRLVKDVALLLSKYSSLRAGAGAAKLVWREVSPQHFAPLSHSRGGLYHGHHVPVTEPCEPHAAGDFAIANGPNNALRETMEQFPWVLRLPVWALSAQRPDAHPRYECTHWCQPGPLSTWVTVLQHLLHAAVVPAGGATTRYGI
jgi:hypothetical protein